MSTDPPPPPDNPPPLDAGPSGPQQPEAGAPPPAHSESLAPPSEPTPRPELAHAQGIISLISLGPNHEYWNSDTVWFALAGAFANAIYEGLQSFSSLSPEHFPQLTQLPSFSQANSALAESLTRAAASSYSQQDTYQADLNNWIRNEITSARHRLIPAINANVDQWRENREAELMAKANKDAEVLVSLRSTGSAERRARATKKGKGPSSELSPTPRRDPSSLGKRSLTEASDGGSDTDMSDGAPFSLSGPADITRTPRAKRVAHDRAPAPAPILPADYTANLDALLKRHFDALDQRLSTLERRSNPLGAQPQAPGPATSLPQRPPVAPPSHSAPPQALQNAPAATSRQKKRGKAPSSFASVAATSAPANPNPTPKPTTKPQPKPPTPKSTEITVQRPALPSEPKETRTPANIIVAQVQQSLREAKSDIPLVFGRWAAHTNNFVYVFSGDIPFSRIQQIGKHLLSHFVGGTLAPVGGWSRILLNGIPTRNSSGSIHSEAELEAALRLNPIFENMQFVMSPRWLLRPEDINTDYASLTFSIHDPDGILTKTILQTPLGVFGAHALARRFESRPPLRQCASCHRLGHIASDPICKTRNDAVRCHLCGGAHPAADHATKCRRAANHQEHGVCDCVIKCINCRREGHHALDTSCPDRARFRNPGRTAAIPNANPTHPVLNV